MINIGIIGNGFVGSAVAQGFSLWTKVRVYDTESHRSMHSLDEVARLSDIIFVCVPTPMDTSRGGKIDLSILDSVMSDLDAKVCTGSLVVIKSTVTPGTTLRYEKRYPMLRLVFNPEFLSERTAKMDFNNPARIVVGGNHDHRVVLAMLYRERFPHVPIIETDAQTAEFIKYACNCFYAVKISILNEFKQMATHLHMDWDAIINGLLSSGWVNPMHTMVPGTDGNLGFGGKCFPKDMNAFINFFESYEIEPSVMKAAWQKNLEVRDEKNWLNIDGATSHKGEQDE